MFCFTPVIILFYLLFSSNPLVLAWNSNDTNIAINVIVGVNGLSTFQCWSIEPPFMVSTQRGIVGARVQLIGDITGGNVVFFNETVDTEAGLHNPPAPQWVMIFRGSCVVTLPSTNAKMHLPAGQFIIANDTAEVSKIGHDTHWEAGSVAVQLPFAEGVVPGHTVLNPNGLCSDSPYDSTPSTTNPWTSLPQRNVNTPFPGRPQH